MGNEARPEAGSGRELEDATAWRERAQVSPSQLQVGLEWVIPARRGRVILLCPGTVVANLLVEQIAIPHQRAVSTLLALTGRLRPLIWSCPTDSTSTRSSTAPAARWLSRIWSAAAWLLSREARITTFPIAP